MHPESRSRQLTVWTWHGRNLQLYGFTLLSCCSVVLTLACSDRDKSDQQEPEQIARDGLPDVFFLPENVDDFEFYKSKESDLPPRGDHIFYAYRFTEDRDAFVQQVRSHLLELGWTPLTHNLVFPLRPAGDSKGWAQIHGIETEDEIWSEDWAKEGERALMLDLVSPPAGQTKKRDGSLSMKLLGPEDSRPYLERYSQVHPLPWETTTTASAPED